MSEPAPHIRLVRVSKSYILGGNEIHALMDVSLDLNRGDFVALCGSSGSGKSTMLNLLGCLALPTRGEVFIGDRQVDQLTDFELALFRSQHLGFIFQNFNLLPVLTALENVEYAMLNAPLSASERRARALSALTEVGLGKLSERRPSQLSGGQRQRVAIARAFVRRPDLIVADEPTANLDKRTAGEVLELMARLNETTGCTVIVATHDPIVIALARRKISISDGILL